MLKTQKKTLQGFENFEGLIFVRINKPLLPHHWYDKNLL